MDLRTRLIAPSFHLKSGNFDIDAVIRRLILFETYIIDSQRLTEIPHLVRIFTLDGLLAILESGALRLNCNVRNTASLGPSLFVDEVPKHKIRPPFHYSFATVEPAEIHQYVHSLLKEIEPEMGLSSKRTVRLRRAIYSALEKPTETPDAFSLKATKDDLISSPKLLACAAAIALNKYHSIQADPADIEITIKYSSDFDFQAKSNIQKRFKLDKLSAHKLIENACVAISSNNDRIEKMKIYSALTGFSDIDIPIFGSKLEFLAKALSPDDDEKRFQRVIELAGLPQIGNHATSVDAKKLLEIRQSSDAREFRQWLSTTDSFSDTEIVLQVRSLSKTFGRVIGGTLGRNIRFLLTNGVGFIPTVGSIISLPLSILDQFILDKIFPRSGITAFVDEMYPSLFEKSF